MRWRAVFAKTLTEQVRNPLVPLLTLAFAPFFVLLIWMFFPSGGSTTYPVVVVNADAGPAGDAAVAGLVARAYADGSPILEVTRVPDRATADAAIADRLAVAFVELPSGFTASLAADAPVPVTIGGDLSAPTYAVAAVLAADTIDEFVQRETGRQPVLDLDEVALGESAARSEFELYVPGVLVFALGMMIFAAAMTAAAEVEAGTLHRLALTPLTSADLLGGITAAQLLLGLAAGAIALGTAVALGFTIVGPWWPVLPIWALTSLGVIGLGLITAALTRTVAQAFLAANFPFGIFMFLSGTMFPVRGVTLFTVGDQPVNLLDVLPPRHAVNALAKVFTYGSTDIGYELAMLAGLSLAFFALGAWLFHRRHLRRGRPSSMAALRSAGPGPGLPPGTCRTSW